MALPNTPTKEARNGCEQNSRRRSVSYSYAHWSGKGSWSDSCHRPPRTDAFRIGTHRFASAVHAGEAARKP